MGPQDNDQFPAVPAVLAEQVEVRGLSFAYPDRELLFSDLTFSVAAGEVLGLAGANGSGKSTLLDLLAGILSPTEGAVSILGGSGTEHLKQGTALLPQNVDNWLLGSTPREDIELALGTGRAGPGARQDAPAVAEVWGIADIMDDPLETLSVGQKKRLALASALAGDPELVLLDEPFAGLDWQGSLTLLADLARLAGRNVAVVLATHDPSMVSGLVGKWLFLKRGKSLLSSVEDAPNHFEEFGVRPAGASGNAARREGNDAAAGRGDLAGDGRDDIFESVQKVLMGSDFEILGSFDVPEFDPAGLPDADLDLESLGALGFDMAGFSAAGFDMDGFDEADFVPSGPDRFGRGAAGFMAAGPVSASFDATGAGAVGFDMSGPGVPVFPDRAEVLTEDREETGGTETGIRVEEIEANKMGTEETDTEETETEETESEDETKNGAGAEILDADGLAAARGDGGAGSGPEIAPEGRIDGPAAGAISSVGTGAGCGDDSRGHGLMEMIVEKIGLVAEISLESVTGENQEDGWDEAMTLSDLVWEK
jgi:biotin transport system ATP-binding protein